MNFRLRKTVDIFSGKTDDLFLTGETTVLERTYKPHYDYQNLSPLANGRGLNRQKYAILQTQWHLNWSVMELKCP